MGAAQAPASVVDGALLLLAENALWLIRQGGPDAPGQRHRGLATRPGLVPGRDAGQLHPLPVRHAGPPRPRGVPWPTGEVLVLRLDVPGATPRPLARREALAEAVVSASWAPDGRALYAVRRRPLGPSAVQADLVRFDVETGAVAELSTPFEATEVSAGPGASWPWWASRDRAGPGCRT